MKTAKLLTPKTETSNKKFVDPADRFIFLKKIFTPWHYKDSENDKPFRGPYSSVDEMFETWDKEKVENSKKYPIRHFIYYEIYLPLYRIWNYHISMIPKEIKWFIQRGKRGWADCDIWSYDNYNARVNRDALTKLKKIQNILPLWDGTEPEEVAQARWHGIMDDMIFAFDSIAKEGNGELEFWYEGCEESREVFKKKECFKDTIWQTKEENERMKKGMQLFIEHYFKLWD